jgi:pyruvate decarboxylase
MRFAVGTNSLPAVKELVEGADLVLSIGPLKSDVNTGSWSGELDQSKVVELHSNHIKIGYATFPAQTYRELLPCVVSIVIAPHIVSPP